MGELPSGLREQCHQDSPFEQRLRKLPPESPALHDGPSGNCSRAQEPFQRWVAGTYAGVLVAVVFLGKQRLRFVGQAKSHA